MWASVRNARLAGAILHKSCMSFLGVGNYNVFLLEGFRTNNAGVDESA